MAHYAGGMAEHPRDDVRWLTPAEKDGWTGLASLVLLLPGRFEAPLQREHGLTLFDYLTLSQLSEADGGRLRMSDLAYLANGSLSRLSNVVKRFEGRGWVERMPDPDDGRYTLVALTAAGRQVGETLSLDADVVMIVSIGIGCVIEGAYVLAKRRGWAT